MLLLRGTRQSRKCATRVLFYSHPPAPRPSLGADPTDLRCDVPFPRLTRASGHLVAPSCFIPHSGLTPDPRGDHAVPTGRRWQCDPSPPRPARTWPRPPGEPPAPPTATEGDPNFNSAHREQHPGRVAGAGHGVPEDGARDQRRQRTLSSSRPHAVPGHRRPPPFTSCRSCPHSLEERLWYSRGCSVRGRGAASGIRPLASWSLHPSGGGAGAGAGVGTDRDTGHSSRCRQHRLMQEKEADAGSAVEAGAIGDRGGRDALQQRPEKVE